MELIPTDRLFASEYELRTPDAVRSGTHFEEGDLLISRITPCFENGKQGIASAVPGRCGVATTEVFPVRPITPDASLEFLAYYILDPDVRQGLAAKMEGATGRQRLPRSALLEWQMPVPSLAEQEAIAAILLHIQTAAHVQQKIVAGLRELKAATMAKLFREGLRGERRKQTEIGEIPKSWEVVPLGELARIGNGSTPRKTEPAYWEGGTLPWLTSAKVHEGVITAADQFVTARAQQECHLPLVPRGSIVIAITGEGRTLGNAALVRIETFVSQHLAFVALTSGRMSSEFLLAYLQSRYEDLRKSGSGGGTTKAALTCGFLSRYLVPVPPLSDQHVIGELRSKLDVRLTQASLRLEALRTLFSSTLHLLMTGQMRVPVGKEA